MQSLQKLINVFYKIYTNKLITTFLTINTFLLIAKLIIYLIETTTKNIK